MMMRGDFRVSLLLRSCVRKSRGSASTRSSGSVRTGSALTGSASTGSVLILLLVALLAGSAHATALGRDVGDGQVRIVGTVMPALWAYDDAGIIVDTPPLVTSAVVADLELGVARDLTLRATLPWHYNLLDDVAAVGVGDATLGGQLRITHDGPVALATRLELKLPLYQAAGPTVRGLGPDGKPALGDGQVDVTALMMLGGRMPFSGYFDVEVGYRFRSGDITDAIVGGLALGARFFDRRLLAAFRLETVYSFDSAADRAETVGRGYAALGPWVAFRVYDSLHLEAGVSYVGRGRNTVGGPAEVSAGVWLPF